MKIIFLSLSIFISESFKFFSNTSDVIHFGENVTVDSFD
jgi:hypothetical protein